MTLQCALLACVLGASLGDIQIELDMVVPTALNESQLTKDIVSAARNVSFETAATFEPAAQVLGPRSDILCLLGLFCYENGVYTYLSTPVPTTAPSQETLSVGAAVAIGGGSALALAGVAALFLCRPKPKKRVVIRATIDWPVVVKRARLR